LTPLVEDYPKEFQVAAAAEIKVIPDPCPQLMSLFARHRNAWSSIMAICGKGSELRDKITVQ